MFKLSKKMLLACILAVVLTTGAWQDNHVVLAESPNADIPLYSGLTWGSPSVSVQDIRININGDSISLSGKRYEARERFVAGLPEDVSDYYSTGELAKSGWTSHDTVQINGGVHYIFYHESGVYLSVEFVACADVSSDICVAVWKSEQPNVTSPPTEVSGLNNIVPAPTSAFGKKTPTNGATNLTPTSVALSWEAYSPAPNKYSYCIKEGSACATDDPNWTSAYTTSVTINNLAYNKTYYWQVKAITCVTCVPKTVVYANNNVAWTFKTKQATQAVIIGNAGVAGAVLKYTDGGVKTVTADGSGNYSITVPLHWSGTVTPSKSGYIFSPKYANFSDLTAPQTIQNFNVIPAHLISGNVGVSGVTLSYTDVTPQTVTSNSNGKYSIMVPNNWSGTVTPSKTGYTFAPTSKSYSNVITNKTAQNYKALVSISGNAGVAGATLSYVDSTLKTVTADGSGVYSLTVPVGWTGSVTPSMTGFTFTPANRSYSNIQSGKTLQNYTATDNPVVLSSVRVSASPTSAPSVDFTVTFSESVTGVDTGDFALTTTGLTSTSVSQVNGSGAVYTVTVSTGSGSGTVRLDVVDDDSIMDGSSNSLGGVGTGNGNFTGGEVYVVNTTTILSNSAKDGWILESSESSGAGGSLDNSASTLRLGDNEGNRQYRSILSFDTSVLPAGVTITSVTLKFKYAGVSGTTPFNTHGNLLVAVRKGAFNNNPILQLNDFKATVGNVTAGKEKVLIFTNTLVDNWYSQVFDPADFQYINDSGVTQFRLRFNKDDNNDLGADYLKIYSGNAEAANRPQLIITYTP